MPVDKCAMCGYCLIGLRLPRRCPECGFECERRVRVFRATHRIVWGICMAGLALVVEVYWLTVIGLPRWTIGSIVQHGMLLVAILGGYGLLSIRRVKIVLGLRGLRIIGTREGSVDIPWSEIHSASWSRLHGGTTLHLTDGSSKNVFGKELFGSHRRARKFVEEVNQCVANYASCGSAAVESVCQPRDTCRPLRG